MRSRTRWRRNGALLPVFLALSLPVVPAAAAQTMAGWSDKQQAKRLEQFARLTPGEVAKLVTTADDDLESVATLTTDRVFKTPGGFSDRVRADNFLRALIDKKSGRTIFQLYAQLLYTGEPRRFNGANFQLDGSIANRPLTISNVTVDCPYGVCMHEEHIAFEIPEALLRELATRADERPVRPWRFRLKAQSGEDWTDDMAPAEAAGLLIAVDRYRREHGLP